MVEPAEVRVFDDDSADPSAREKRVHAVAMRIVRAFTEERIRRALDRVTCVVHGRAAVHVQIRYATDQDREGSVVGRACCDAMKPLLLEAARRAVEEPPVLN
jgi:hypothetical protein